ncbi:Non-specific phospholipase C2 [Forsythia ovata]|uniref:Non-specific phospholipase C2 n=1 Tax=Forsythia ovata TaxID=205694 RepID=A0ABD1VF21_9LAMI
MEIEGGRGGCGGCGCGGGGAAIAIRQGDANEDSKVSEFQQVLILLAAVLIKRRQYLNILPRKDWEGKEYMEDAVKHFFESGSAAKLMGVGEERIVKMRPSLSPKSSKPQNQNP